MPMPAAGAAHALRRRLVYGHRLAPQGSRFIPENPSDRQVSDTDQNTTPFLTRESSAV